MAHTSRSTTTRLAGAALALGLATAGFGVVNQIVLPTASQAAAVTAGWSNPVVGKRTSVYLAPRGGYPHAGIDIAAASGTPLHAAAAGTVEKIATGRAIGDKRGNGVLPNRSGNAVLIKHASGYTYYGHLKNVHVKAGQKVSAGQVIGLLGTTGNSSGPHLHFEVHSSLNKTVNPGTFLSGKGISLGTTTPLASTGWPSLAQGSTAKNVRVLQYLLKAQGTSTTVSGSYTSSTVTSVKNFQKSKGLLADGKAGPWTWSVVTKPAASGSKGDLVRAVQTALNNQGIKVSVTGTFDAATVKAVKTFQAKKKLVADGQVGPLTWTALV